MPALSSLSFAYSGSHPVNPLPADVIERTEAPDAPAFEREGSKLHSGKPLDPSAGAPRVLSRRSVCVTIASVAQTYGLPIPFFANVIWQESTFDPRVISHAGALGIAQFMPRTAVYYGLINPFEPIHALNVSARFLSELHERFGNLGLAAAAYNAGPTRVVNWMAGKGGLPNETRNYLLRVTGKQAENWSDADALKDPEMSLMPARAPCSEVTEAVRQQTKVVRVAKLVIELAAATRPAKPVEPEVAAAKPAPEAAEAKPVQSKDIKVARGKKAEPAREEKVASTDGKRAKDERRRDPRKDKAAAKVAKQPADRKGKVSGPPVEKKAKVAARR